MPTNMFLERTFPAPLSVEDVHERGRSSDWCFDMHKVDWRASFLSAGGRTLVCWFSAPDAESTRTALRGSGADTQMLWAGTVHESPETVIPNVLVERTFDQPVSFEAIQSQGRAAGWCLQTHQVKYSRSFFATDRKRMLCLYHAPDAESVRLVQRESALPFNAVWAFDWIGRDTPLSRPR